MELHDDRCASHKGHPCNCPAAAFKPKAPPAEAPVPFVCPLCEETDPRGMTAHALSVHQQTHIPAPRAATGPDLVAILADYFTGPDLSLCSLAMSAQEETTARRRAERYFKARDAFGIPREVDLPEQVQPYIIHALSRFITDN